ncbi:MAG: sialidase family protein [Gemmatimonadales bacterium]
MLSSFSARRRAAVSLLALLAAPAPGTDPVIELSGAPGSRSPFVFASPGGTVLASWLEPAGDGRWSLRVAERDAQRWSAPRTVVTSDRLFVNWADFPSVVELADGRWVAHWLEKTAARAYAYHVRLATSADRGATWSAPVTPHRDTSPTEHGFVSMVPGPRGGADLIWLDGRDFEGTERRGAMRLYAGGLGADGRPAAEAVLDARACECCQTALARTDRGLIAAWRDRSEGEIRDVAVSRLVNGRWTEPVIPHPDSWEFRACPVNGPQLAADGRRVALAWYSGAGAPGVYLTLSGDGGATFGPRLRLDDGNPLGRLEVLMLPEGSVVVFWLETTGETAEWRARRYGPDGSRRDHWTVTGTSRLRDAGFLRAAAGAGGVFVGWTAGGATGGVRIARQSLPRASR